MHGASEDASSRDHLASRGRDCSGKNSLSTLGDIMNSAGRAIASVLLAAMIGSCGPGWAQQDFFAGKTINLIIPAGPGGAFALYGQVLAEFMSKHIPGHPHTVLQYMSEAGGIAASNYVANNASNDGTVIYMIHQSAVTHQLLFPNEVNYDARKFIPIGIMTSLNSALVIRKDAPASDQAGFQKKQIILGATGPGSYQYIVPTLINHFQNTKFKVIPGFKGTNNLALALDRGEIQGFWASLIFFQTYRPDWATGKGVAKIAFQMGIQANQAISKVPLLTSLAKSDQERALYRLLSLEESIGRSLVAPAGVPPRRIAILRTALTAALHDPEFIGECAKRKIPLQPGSANDLKRVIDEGFSTPSQIIAEARKFMLAH